MLAVVATPAGADLGPGLLEPGGAPLRLGGSPDGGAPGAAVVVPRPLQSWQQLGSGAVAADARRPALVLRRLPAVMRRDACARFSLAEVAARGGLGATLADRLLPEIAYKIGRAPKYGA